MWANVIKYVWRDDDGTLHTEILEVNQDNTPLDIVSVAAYERSAG